MRSMPSDCVFALAETAEAYVLGRLEATEFKAFQAHLDGCKCCQHSVKEILALKHLLQLAAGDEHRCPNSQLPKNGLGTDTHKGGDTS